ncbi:MAG: PepSY domain-containing protein [Flavobacteriaceae bacterium]|nr:PepSY domain-containing protein [Flavobacteriaceae bacterium]
MSKRNYNVFFNAHTVSGIVISVALYIIFFAGAFALFKDEITTWQEGSYVYTSARKDIDFDRILSSIDKEHSLVGRNVQLYIDKEPNKIYASISASKDSLALETNKTSQYFSVNIQNLEKKTYSEGYSLGEFLYRLHFFHQIPSIGIYLAGFIALFFLFAIVTGVIVHWKKMISNFYDFNPKNALKRVWSDAHTALGLIGLPFQFVFAITGAYFALTLLVLLPANFIYNGDQVKLMEELRPERRTIDWITASKQDIPSYNDFVLKSDSLISDFHPHMVYIKNYGGVNMQYILTGNISDKESFAGTARFVHDQLSKEFKIEKHPDTFSYIEDVQAVVSKLHFAEYGGSYIKIIYFILAFITCFVIITGFLFG